MKKKAIQSEITMTNRRTITLAAALSLAGVVALAGVLSSGMAFSQPTGPQNEQLRHLTNNKVAVHVGQKAFTVTLYDNPTAKDLLARLPLTVKASNYPGYDEKVLRLGKGLSMEGAPPGDNPEIPEVGYYEPGQWIAIYYGPIGYWPGKVPLGRIDASTDEIHAIPENATVTIDRVTN